MLTCVKVNDIMIVIALNRGITVDQACAFQDSVCCGSDLDGGPLYTLTIYVTETSDGRLIAY